MSRFVLITLGGTDKAADAPRPNIVAILSDNMGDSDLGCSGSEIATSNLDGWA